MVLELQLTAVVAVVPGIDRKAVAVAVVHGDAYQERLFWSVVVVVVHD